MVINITKTAFMIPHQIAINYEVGFWPWMASLGYWSDDGWSHVCGTTLVSRNHYITAAHCLSNYDPKRYWNFKRVPIAHKKLGIKYSDKNIFVLKDI